MERRGPLQPTTATLVDILDKVLDKGLVVAGDIRVSLANVELLTIQVRLLICSIDKATEIGLDWWRHDRFLGGDQEEAVTALRERVAALERQLAAANTPAPELGTSPRTSTESGASPRTPRRTTTPRRRRTERES
jgi:hypothetical protein